MIYKSLDFVQKCYAEGHTFFPLFFLFFFTYELDLSLLFSLSVRCFDFLFFRNIRSNKQYLPEGHWQKHKSERYSCIDEYRCVYAYISSMQPLLRMARNLSMDEISSKNSLDCSPKLEVTMSPYDYSLESLIQRKMG